MVTIQRLNGRKVALRRVRKKYEKSEMLRTNPHHVYSMHKGKVDSKVGPKTSVHLRK